MCDERKERIATAVESIADLLQQRHKSPSSSWVTPGDPSLPALNLSLYDKLFSKLLPSSPSLSKTPSKLTNCQLVSKKDGKTYCPPHQREESELYNEYVQVLCEQIRLKNVEIEQIKVKLPDEKISNKKTFLSTKLRHQLLLPTNIIQHLTITSFTSDLLAMDATKHQSSDSDTMKLTRILIFATPVKLKGFK